MTTDHTDLWTRLSETVIQLMEKYEVPGVAVGILHNGERQTGGFGVTNVDHPLPVTDETLFQIGSITKTVTGTLIMRLVEQGKVDLDAPVRTYLPDFAVSDAEASERATVRHLLTHMSGWEGDFFHDTGSGDDALVHYVADMANLEQLAPIDTVWSYNNAGFAVLGRIIEVVTERPYHAVLKEMVLDPLGMEHAFLDPGDAMTHRFAVGHNVGDDGAAVARPWPLGRYACSMGGLACHVKDLLRYARFHLGEGTTASGDRLLDEEMLRQMQSPQAERWGDKEQIALTWFVDAVDGVREISHGGGTVGQISLLTLVPERDFALAIFTNANRGGQVTQHLRRWVLREYLGLDVPKPAPMETSDQDLSEYVGRYSRPFAEIELGVLGGRLIGQITFKKGFPNEDVPPNPAPPPFTLALCEPDRLLIVDGPMKDGRAEIIRKPDGSIGWLRMGRIHRRREG